MQGAKASIFLAIALLVPGRAAAETVFDNLGGAPVGAPVSGPWIDVRMCRVPGPCDPVEGLRATSFTTPAGGPKQLDSLDLPLSLPTYSGPNATAGIGVWTDAGGLPGAVVESLGLVTSTSEPRVYRIPSVQRPLLQPNTTYWVSVAPGFQAFFPIVAHWYEGATGAPRSHALRPLNSGWQLEPPANFGLRVTVVGAAAPVPAAPPWGQAAAAAMLAGVALTVLARRRNLSPA